MKLTLDFNEKKIWIEEDVNLKDLLNTIGKIVEKHEEWVIMKGKILSEPYPVYPVYGKYTTSPTINKNFEGLNFDMFTND